MVEAGCSIPFPEAIFAYDPLCGWRGSWREGGDGGEDGLETAVEGRGVEALDGGIEGGEVGG